VVSHLGVVGTISNTEYAAQRIAGGHILECDVW